MSEKLVSCPSCHKPNFTERGLKAHRCKGPALISVPADPPATEAEVTDEQPRDPAWDAVRETAGQIKLMGRLMLRGQVRLGMLLAGLKKEHGIRPGKGIKTSADSAKVPSWEEKIRQETGYSRRSADEFIRLYEAAKAKLKTSKKLNLPKEAKKDAIVLFRAENPLALSEQQWEQVDAVIGSLTDGETQATLMQELGIVPKPKPMPKPKKDEEQGGEDIEAGQLAFHFFEAVAAPLINARTNPDYKKLLYALPAESSEEQPLSLATLEAEFRAALADIQEVKEATAKPAKARIVA